ncbi:hypothetical protein ACT4ML_18095 [Natrinema sp. LN54]|uniref:hypothetical protein n=1 Tax=Natrinema sp. LN54 TaxID=3458705 RepID=UPI004035145B
MPALETALLERVGARIIRILISAFAGYLAIRVVDGFFAQLAAVVVFAVALTAPWELVNHLRGSDSDDRE